MTEKQRRFADEYLIDLNATRAYRAAYPSVKRDHAAEVNGSLLLRNTEVTAYIQARKKELQEHAKVSQERIIEELAAIAFDDAQPVQVRLRALELLGKHLGLFDRKDKLDREEQEARIAKLRADTRTEGAEDRTVTVRFVDFDGMEDAAE